MHVRRNIEFSRISGKDRLPAKYFLLGLTVACGSLTFSETGSQRASAAPVQYRQYYSSWSYQPQKKYHYCRYYYKPTTNYSGYKYHYAVRYPRTYSPQPRYSRYVYFYNPHRKVYWGRFDLEGKPGEQYSLLKDEDRKSNLEDIPEKAFPKPARMPVIPDSEDEIQILPIDLNTLPQDTDVNDLPPGSDAP
jgi:hypothetical protein